MLFLMGAHTNFTSFFDSNHIFATHFLLQTTATLAPPLSSLATILPHDPETPSPPQRTSSGNQRKRPGEDMSQFAGEVARANKLVKADHDQLQDFAKFDRSQQMIFIAGSLFALGHHQRLLQPADAQIVVPKKLRTKILEHAAGLIIDSSIPAYRDENIGPNKLLMDLAHLHGVAWGFTNEMKTDRDQVKAIKDEIGSVLINKRHTLKSTVSGSLGSDPAPGETLRPDAVNIVDLATLLTSQLKASTKVDIGLCGRVALLRKIITEGNDNKFWTLVDSELAKMRAKYPNAVDLSKFIKKHILDPDFKTYGSVDLAALGGTGRRRAAVANTPSTLAGPSVSGSNANSNAAAI
ncbi:hypothetical protein FB451DRAFT_1296150 [Mycena latifolia]|nr:hypothetical protein FB451DRAFT_1296150 [Mycena latifolia]